MDERKQRWIVALILTAAGLFGNVVSVPLFFGVDFLFGSVFCLMAVGLLGLWPAVAVTLIVSSYTFFLWNHPFAILIFTGEVVAVGCAMRRGYRNLVFLDWLFWMALGMPLVWLFYSGFMSMNTSGWLVIMLKQAVNGVFNAVISSFLLLLLGLRWKGHGVPALRWHPERISMRQVLFMVLTAVVMAPVLAGTILDSRREFAEIGRRVRNDLNRTTEDTLTHIDDWLQDNLRAVRELAGIAREIGVRQSPELQLATMSVARLNSHFHNMYVADATATTIAFHPPTNHLGQSTLGISFADREYFPQLKTTREPVLSDVFLGRGGVFDLIGILSVPILDGDDFLGFALGAIDLEDVSNLLKDNVHSTHLHLTLFDSTGQNIASTGPDHSTPPPGLDPGPDWDVIPIGGGNSQWLPGDRGLNPMVRWRQSFYTRQSSVDVIGSWRILAQIPVAPYQSTLYRTYIINLATALVMISFGFVIAEILSRRICAPLTRLAALTTDMPDQLQDKQPVCWPESALEEVSLLIGNFQRMMDRLQEHLKNLKAMEDEHVRIARLRALGEMAAGVSHNLNNILVGVFGHAQLLQMISRDPDVLVETENILVAAGQARDLVRRLNHAVRGGDSDQPEAVDLNMAVHKAVQTTRPRWKDEPESANIPIVLELDLDETIPAVVGTEAGLGSILVNLIFNAVDAMPEGGTLRLESAPGPKPDTVTLIVSDTGVGMDQATVDRVFEPFFTTKCNIGTGLGLSTVYGTVNRWGGAVDVRSAPGQGTTFTLTLHVFAQEQSREQGAANTAPDRRRRILLVDDDERVRRVVSRLISDRHTVVTASSGPEAIRLVDEDRFDIALIDLGMPDMAGNQVAERLRRVQPFLVTVMISGWDLNRDDERLAPFDLTLSKPFADVTEVRHCIERAVELHDQRVRDGSGSKA